MKLHVLSVLLVCVAATARADGPPPHPHADPIHDKLLPPELIMGHQQELGIDAKQREAMIKDIEKTQALVTELSWKMSAAVEEGVKLLDAPKIDEAKALAAADRIMSLENDIKKAHLMLLVRLRNALTDAQRAKAFDLRKQMGGAPPPPHP